MNKASVFEKYKDPDDLNYYLDSSGCSHNSKKDLLTIGFLDFCGCGYSLSALVHLYQQLKYDGRSFT
jgi:hypothetical protein